MRLERVLVRNFRGLREVEFELPARLCVLVGPNGVGKSSVLEAIRLAKSLLFPSYEGESNQVLQTLGSFAPHLGKVAIAPLLGDTNKELLIRLTLRLEANEVVLLKKSSTQLAASRLRATFGMLNEMQLTNFLSTEDGRKQLEAHRAAFDLRVEQIEQNPQLSVSLNANPSTGLMRGDDLVIQLFLGHLARSVPPRQGLFSYFPADRAMPVGEVPVQLGTQDMQQNMQSHMGQPSLKYSRLKNYVFSQFLSGEDSGKRLHADFDLVFKSLLRDKTLKGFKITETGFVSIVVREDARNAEYDIDNMSSGEKGLVLTFLMLRQACAPNGVILLDEPELHLNPSVTKRVVPFLVDEILAKTPSQALVCTHSHEIIAASYEREDCSLLHLRGANVISPVRRQDKAEIKEVLRRLGVDTLDVLASRGTIFVEGKDDLDLLEVAFPDRVSGYRIVPLGGRGNIESEIKALQSKEEDLDSVQCFIFDLDNKPSGLVSTEHVKVAQWDRRCFENYLLEQASIFDALTTIPATKKPASMGEVRPALKAFALLQIPTEAAHHAYDSFDLYGPGFPRKEVEPESNYSRIADIVSRQIERSKSSLCGVEVQAWKRDFEERARTRHEALSSEWDEGWYAKADGKKILFDFYKSLQPRLAFPEFKRRIALEWARARHPSWREVDSILNELLPVRS